MVKLVFFDSLDGPRLLISSREELHGTLILLNHVDSVMVSINEEFFEITFILRSKRLKWHGKPE